MECFSHKGENVIMTCSVCEENPLVCAVCMEESHDGHSFVSLKTAANYLRQKIEKTRSDNQRIPEEIQSDLDAVNNLKANLQQEGNLVENEIEKHVGIIKREVDAMKEDALRKHKMALFKNTDSLNIREEELKRQLSSVKRQIHKFQERVAQIEKLNDYVEVIKAGKDIEVPEFNRVPLPDIHSLTFTPGNVDEEGLGHVFGRIMDETAEDICSSESSDVDVATTSSKKIFVKVTLVTSFKPSKNDAIGVVCCPEAGNCLIKYQDKNSVKLLNRSRQIEHSINLGTQTSGFTVTSNNRLLFCCTTQECIKEMELPDGDIFGKIDTSPLTPNYVCTGPSGHIYVTLYDEDDYEVTEDSTRVLIQYDRWGGENGRCERNQFDKNIFVVPEEVSVNQDETKVAVINRISDNRRDLILLDKDLSPMLVYTGPSVLTGNSLQGFEVYSAAFDTKDNIVVAEHYSGTVQLLSPSCEPLQVLVRSPNLCVMTAHQNEVWIGDDEGNVGTFRYFYETVSGMLDQNSRVKE
ncbi:uncharacterized protein LOC132558426 [Ylistrum balloti]|uniref:uncharacterized protein LOC132558426 n=1 Tax=Ylistrum balloti TaxID=509963 RepID=UPI002905DCFE|nr:uncharacterized protein LOC132558426 [Ylistrum balloti]